MDISVIVTNWNGLPLLQKNLLRVIDTSRLAGEIIIADDASTDGSVKFIKRLQKNHPKIRLIQNKKNIGFGRNSNKAVKLSKGKLVVLLNNDIYPYSGYIKNCLKHFHDPKTFGVGFCEIGNKNWGQVYWKSGYLQYRPGKNTKKSHISAWLSGGGCLVRRRLFLKLGGFDSVYEPFYCEDLDLGLRAWRSGYRLLWEPSARIKHRHESTMSRFPHRFLDYVKERNRLLTVWRNITDTKLLRAHRWAKIGRVLSGPNYIKIIHAAKKQIKKYPPPLVFPKLTDRQILQLFTSPAKSQKLFAPPRH